jgi:hypothetical protein
LSQSGEESTRYDSDSPDELEQAFAACIDRIRQVDKGHRGHLAFEIVAHCWSSRMLLFGSHGVASKACDPQRLKKAVVLVCKTDHSDSANKAMGSSVQGQ